MRVCRNFGIVFLILWCGWTPVESAPENPPGMLGFSPGAVEEQRRLESKLDASLDPAQIGDWIRELSARPHHPGSPKGRENAQFMESLFRSWGYETRLDEYRILFPTPKLRRLEMLEPEPFRARLIEPALAEDSTSNQTSEQLPAYNAYSPDGEATGQLVYVNYGIPVRLRAVGAPRHPGQGPDRHRPLRWFLEGAQAQAGSRAGGAGLHHLFRPQRRRILPG